MNVSLYGGLDAKQNTENYKKYANVTAQIPRSRVRDYLQWLLPCYLRRDQSSIRSLIIM